MVFARPCSADLHEFCLRAFCGTATCLRIPRTARLPHAVGIVTVWRAPREQSGRTADKPTRPGSQWHDQPLCRTVAPHGRSLRFGDGGRAGSLAFISEIGRRTAASHTFRSMFGTGGGRKRVPRALRTISSHEHALRTPANLAAGSAPDQVLPCEGAAAVPRRSTVPPGATLRQAQDEAAGRRRVGRNSLPKPAENTFAWGCFARPEGGAGRGAGPPFEISANTRTMPAVPTAPPAPPGRARRHGPDGCQGRHDRHHRTQP